MSYTWFGETSRSLSADVSRTNSSGDEGLRHNEGCIITISIVSAQKKMVGG